MKKIILINPVSNSPDTKGMYPSGSLLLLGTILKKKGYKVTLINQLAEKKTTEDIIELVKIEKPDWVGLSISTFQLKETRKLLQRVNRIDRGIKTVVGGPHPSAEPDFWKTWEVKPDYVILGEGEKSLLQLLEGKVFPYTIISQKERVELDNLPVVDLDLLPKNWPYTGASPYGPGPGMFMMASRGCPFRCIFCSKPIFGKTVTYMSPERVLEELLYFRKRGFKEVFLMDDTLNLNWNWSSKLLSLIRREGLNKDMVFRAPFRANKNLVSLELLKEFKASGFWLIFYGVESGSQIVLDAMKKDLTLEEIKRAFALTKQADIKTEAAFIVGLPEDTLTSTLQTLKLIREIKPFWLGIGTAIPFPGTELYKMVKDKLIISNFEEFRQGLIYYEQPLMPEIAIKNAYEILHLEERGSKIKSLIANPKITRRILERGIL